MTTERTLLATLESCARLAAGKRVVRFAGAGSYTAGDLLAGAARAASVLAEAGVRPGDRVAIMLDNKIEFLWAFFGAAHLGAVSVPLNTHLRGPLLQHQLGQSGPSLTIVTAAALPAATEALAAIGHASPVLTAHSQDARDFGARVSQAPERPRGAQSETDLCTIMYTSGTTGAAKGIMLCGSMMLGFTETAQWVLGYRPDDVAHTCLPLFHANALLVSLLAGLRQGATVVIGERFSATSYWREVRECSATVISLLGSMVPILWARQPAPDDAQNEVRLALTTPMPSESSRPFESRFSVQLTSLYGLTDLGMPIGVPAGTAARAGYCGVAHSDWECAIVDETDTEVPPGVTGELVVRPRKPYRMQLGYWRNSDATASAWRNLWFHTGDLLQMEPDGWFRFVDRKKDAIRRFGENISSAEVEAVIETHPAVAEAAVFAVPSELAEDEVMAAVVLRDGAESSPRAIAAYCTRQLPYFAVPRYIDVRTALPRTVTAKIRKEVLRAQGVTASTWDGGPTRRGSRH